MGYNENLPKLRRTIMTITINIPTPRIVEHIKLSRQLKREHARIEESVKRLAETTLVPGYTKIYA